MAGIYDPTAQQRRVQGMRKANYDELFRLYKDYLGKFYPGRLLTPRQEGAFSEYQKYLEKERGKAEERGLETLYARGIEGATPGTEYLKEYVEEPYAEATAKLGLERETMIEAERQRRHGEAMGYAESELEAQRRRKAGIAGTIGKLVGTGLGVAATIATGGTAAPILAGVGGLLGGVGGGGQPAGQPNYGMLNQMVQFLEQNKGNGNILDFIKTLGSPYQQPRRYLGPYFNEQGAGQYL